ncbi:MAG: glycosyltransferase family 9 protein [Chitinophagaceae bacterium]
MGAPGRNILIYRLGSLGDTVMALPCFHQVRNRFPDANITLLTNRPVMAKAAALEAVLGSGYFYDEVLHYPVGTRSPRLLMQLIKQIRSLNIDTVVNLTATRSSMSGKRDWLFFKAAGVKKFIGFVKPPKQAQLPVIVYNGLQKWEAKRLVEQIESLGPVSLEDDSNWDLKLTQGEKNNASSILDGVSPGRPILAIGTGTKAQANDWGTGNWLQLMQQLKNALPGWQLLVIGAPEEATMGDVYLKAWGDEGLNLCGKTSPRVSAAILDKTAIYIGHDSGPMHLAACMGTPCVGIFSGRNLPGRWFPRGTHNKIIYHKTACSGCGLEVCIEEKKKCILSISVNEVQRAVLELSSIHIAKQVQIS